MALDISEAIDAGIKTSAIATDLQIRIKALTEIPPADRKAVDYAAAFGADPEGPQMKIAALIDQVEQDIKD